MMALGAALRPRKCGSEREAFERRNHRVHLIFGWSEKETSKAASSWSRVSRCGAGMAGSVCGGALATASRQPRSWKRFPAITSARTRGGFGSPFTWGDTAVTNTLAPLGVLGIRHLIRWNPAQSAIVWYGETCTGVTGALGLPSVIQTGSCLAVFYDAPRNAGTAICAAM